ncbi:MAG: aspartate kinase [Gammaproteobacteria bacterium]
MALLVQKYGGSSVGSVELIRRVAERVVRTREQGHDVVVVLSAMGDATDRLLDLARELGEHPSGRELDVLLATGEQVSVALMCMALAQCGCRAKSFTGGQVRILTDGAFNDARIRQVDSGPIAGELGSGCVPVVAGFQGVDDAGNVTTIGRGGSDTTAVALAAALKADECQILSDVDGVYTTDPRMVADARRLDRITFEEMLEMAGQGARILQLRAVAFAGRYNVPLRVLSSTVDGPGTLISYEEPDMEAPVVSGIAFNRDEAEITVTQVPDEPGTAHRILAPVSNARIEVDMIVLNAPREGRVDFSFTVNRADYRRAMELVKREARELDVGEVLGNDRVVKLSVVGVGMRSHAGIATTLFDTLARNGINVRMISTSEIKISVLLDEQYLERGVRSLHAAFGLDTDATARTIRRA